MAALTETWVLGLLVLLAVTCGAWGAYSFRRERQQRLRELLERPHRRRARGADDEPRGLVPLLAARLRPLLPSAWLEELRWRLLWAGRPHGWSPEEFLAARVGATLLLGALGPPLAAGAGAGMGLVLAGALALFAWTLPAVWLNGRISRRRAQINRELPLFLDLVAAAVEAGLGLGEAVRRVADELPGLLAAEFLRAQAEMAAGKSRAAAWRDLMDRTPSPELRTVVLSILQAEQYGTSIAEQLRLQVKQLRDQRQLRAQQVAQAAAVKMRVPMLLFIMLPFLALVIGPALIGLAQLLVRR